MSSMDAKNRQRGGRQLLRTWRWAASVSLVTFCGTALSASLAALQPLGEASLREQSSLKFIPADAAFYSSSMRMRQRFDAFVKSRAFARLSSLPAVKKSVVEMIKAWSEASEKAKENAGADPADDDENGRGSDADLKQAVTLFNRFWGDPENRKLVDLLVDGVSHEMFSYGDSSLIDLAKSFEELSVAIARVQATVPGADDNSPEAAKAQAKAFEALADQFGKTPIPAFVVGFKLTNAKPAHSQVARFESLLKEKLKEVPGFEGRLRREKVGQDEFLTLQLDGSQIPWDEIIKSAEANADGGDSDDLQSKIKVAPALKKLDPALQKAAIQAFATRMKTRKLSISLGFHENYLLLSIGETNAHLAKLAGGGKRLIDRPELAPVLKAADKPLTGISYVSQDLSSILEGTAGKQHAISQFIETYGSQMGLEEATQAKILKDVVALENENVKHLPEPSALTTWEYLTPKGSEGFSYRWQGGPKSADGSKRLSILDHVGGDPLLVVAGRTQGALERYNLAMRWLAVIAPHVDTALNGKMPPEALEFYGRFKTEFGPLATRFDNATRTLFLPALADGQSAFVLDAAVARKSWHPAMPESSRALPFPAPAFVYGVSDADLLDKACRDYFDQVQELINATQRLYPGVIPPVRIPPPLERKTKEGRLFLYKLPEELQISSDIAPTAGLNGEVAVLSLLPEQARKLLSKTPFAPEGFLARREAPAAGAWYFNFSGTVDAVKPWIEYGLDQAMESNPEQFKEEDAAQTLTILEILKCWRGSAGISYFDGPAFVEFKETVYEDLK